MPTPPGSVALEAGVTRWRYDGGTAATTIAATNGSGECSGDKSVAVRRRWRAMRCDDGGGAMRCKAKRCSQCDACDVMLAIMMTL